MAHFNQAQWERLARIARQKRVGSEDTDDDVKPNSPCDNGQHYTACTKGCPCWCHKKAQEKVKSKSKKR